ncbi:MAG: hypothetical protein R3F35_12760 [Myxococcota bacterium]
MVSVRCALRGGLVLLLMLLAHSGSAELNAWSGVGPYGGAGWRIEMVPGDPTHLYALGFRSGLFESVDSGATWARIDFGMPGLDRNRLVRFALDPQNPATLYVVSEAAGVLRSLDGGDSWATANTGLPAQIDLVVPDPSTAGVAYAAWADQLYKTIDSGAIWTTVGAGLTISNTVELLIHPTDPNVVYALGYVGVFQSVDGGATFDELTNGVPAPQNGYRFASQGAFDPVDPDVFYVLFQNKPLYWTTDGGATFAQRSTFAIGDSIQEMVVDPLVPTRLYLAALNQGIQISTDGGVTFTRLLPTAGLGRWSMRDIAIDPGDASHLWVATFEKGLFESVDGGASWTERNAGFDAHTVSALLFDDASGRLYAGVKGGLAWSDDGGGTWTQNVADDFRSWIFSLGRDVATPGRLLMGTNAAGLYETLTSGAEIHAFPLTPLVASPPYVIYDIVVPRSATSTFFLAGGGGGPIVTPDAGTSWSSFQPNLSPPFTGTPQVDSIAVVGDQPLILYGGSTSFSEGGVFQSVDGGASWARKSPTFGVPGRVKQLAVHPTDPDLVFAASAAFYTYRSDDGGDTWNTLPGPGPQPIGAFTDFYIDDADPALMYLVASGENLYRSLDAGQSWEPALTAPPGDRLNAVTVDPSDPSRVFVGSDDIGFRTYTFATDLSVGAGADAAQVDVGGTLGLSVTLDNLGPIDASQVALRIATTELALASATPSICTQGPGEITCAVGLLADGATSALELTLDAVASGSSDIVLELDAREGELDPASATAAVPITVPEPGTVVGALVGALGLGGVARSRRAAAPAP